jgi:hypothetical protein
MRFRDRTVRSVGDMLRALDIQVAPKQPIWFRGHAKRDWPLIPGLARKVAHLKAESALIKRFIQNAVPHLSPPPQEEWEWLFLMQHHRASTRLLDWTESPLAALYFAAEGTRHTRSGGCVWCLDPIALNNAAKVKFPFAAEIPAFGIDPVLESYLPSRVQQNPAELFPLAIMGPRSTPRMAAQLGVFTINHRVHTPIEELGDERHVWRWLIPAAAKPRILDQLARLGITALTLFPELDRVADLSKELLEE